jgi:hypothetical protein
MLLVTQHLLLILNMDAIYWLKMEEDTGYFCQNIILVLDMGDKLSKQQKKMQIQKSFSQ